MTKMNNNMPHQSHVDPNLQEERPARVNSFSLLWKVTWVGAVLATMFTAWTPLGLLPTGLAENLNLLINSPSESNPGLFPAPTERPKPRIGIVAGHWGNDVGTVCQDGLTEDQINLEIATLVKERLTAAGFEVDLMGEFDDKLFGYTALVLVSIHADSCQFVDLNAKIGRAHV